MKIPEPLFKIINPLMTLLLRSPFHFVVSSSILVLTFRGRKSGRWFATPLRYVPIEDTTHVRCFSDTRANWWRNLRGGADVQIQFRGRKLDTQASVLNISVEEKAFLLNRYLTEYPGDATYHDVSLTKAKKPSEADVAIAAEHAVIVDIAMG